MEGKGRSLNKEFDFRSWHCGRQGGKNFNKELEFRSWHCGRQEGGGSLNKELILDHGIVEGKRIRF